MARPITPGVSYFPFNVDLFRDRKFRKLKRKYGSVSVMVYIILISMVYEDKGYYMDYGEDVQEDIWDDIQECLRGKYMPDLQTIGEIITDLAANQLFDRDSFDRQVITSRHLQRNYYKAKYEWRNVNIDWDKWLLSEEEMRGLGSSNAIYKKFVNRTENKVNRTENKVNRTENKVNRAENPQSRVEKSKEDKSIDTLSTSINNAGKKSKRIDHKGVMEYWNAHCGNMGQILNMTDSRKNVVRTRINKYGRKDFCNVILMAGRSDFLNGGNDKGWTADFDWIMKPDHFQQILEGKYSRSTHKDSKNHDSSGSFMDMLNDDGFMGMVEQITGETNEREGNDDVTDKAQGLLPADGLKADSE